ncbi:hypothetical protein PHET_02333 [Paragonimus heterotremus]|uniref:Ras-associating domain-containing protein n=1 Tax=Paragonimus heterotremus TaxID=100268 RepID=A0A8J4WIS5_9TREM|nr:hypothetical protein PHET_02333 [Paragonimus heterotremus]
MIQINLTLHRNFVLQGLEKEKTVPCHSGSVPKVASKEPLPSGHVNHIFLSEPSSPKQLVPCPRIDAHFNPVPREIGRSVEPPHSTPNAAINLTNRSVCSSILGGSFTRHATEFSEKVGLNGCSRRDPLYSTHTFKDATAERDLNSLLRDLEVVEERMKELEQENTSFSRRYSLASSPTSSQPTDVQSSNDSKLYANKHDNHSMKISPNKENGFISAQWVAELNKDAQIVTQKGPAVSTTQASSPPAFLGAGDACMSPPTSPQPPTPSLGLLQQTEAGLWCVTHNSAENTSTSPGPGNGFQVRQRIEAGRSMSDDGQSTSTRLLSEACYKNGPAAKSRPREHYQYPGPSAQLRSTGLQSARTGPLDVVDHSVSITPSPDRGIIDVVHTHIPNSTHTRQQEICRVNDPVALRRQDCCREWGLPQQSTQLNVYTQPNKARDGEDDRSLSGVGSWSPGHPPIRRDKMKSHSLAEAGEIDRLSHSISPESSLSDKSNPDSNQSITYSRDGMERSQIKKQLVVRIFRPDRTTKAIMIDEQMTAGEIASMLIEKNFLKPSTSLAVVEKVPALKIERVFEEHDKVSECILSWPTGSQNMIFFEDRKDHFGFIESPKYWFGEEFAEVYGYNSADAVQTMLSNLEQAGFPEWRDYLYIRKPGEKTWSRRFCVLRSSGLYTSKRNKKSLSSTDLIRILILDSQLQLYTTTGGWSRLRAPTPHGFAFKPYSAQDTTSKHVFCFCATDEKALRNWICRLRIAKFGRQLFINYQNALARVQRQIAIRHAPPAGLYNMNGSLSAYIQRKSSFDILTSSTSTVAITPAESASSLTLNTGSPSVPKKFLLGRHQQPDSKQPFADPRFGQVTNRFALESERSVSPLLLRSQQPTTQATSHNKPYPISQPQMTNSSVDRGLTSRVSYALPQTVIAGSQTPTSGSCQPDRKPTTINYV